MISFVVPAYNEEKYLAATLRSIHESAQEAGEAYEIVVADDASTDATARIARALGARVVPVEKRQIAATRNAGARATSGDMLVFVDADTTVNAPVVAAAVAAMRAGAVGGGAEVRFGDAPRWAHVGVAVLVPFFRIVKWAAGCFVFCTREGFEKTGGFDETYFAGEEIIFSRALKRHGRFAALREAVTTSARKTESFSLWQTLWLVAKILVTSPGGIRKRSAAGFWYDARR